jgi:putative methionine-R-sulfoxide reductase with GAF domain
MKALVEDQRNWVCNTANASSLLWHMFHSIEGPSTAVNWAGFYVVDKRDPSQLILGPFHGKVACQTIKIGSGVCGTVAMNGSSLVLEDVETFPGHIACDGDSKSEVVVPIAVDGKVGWGVPTRKSLCLQCGRLSASSTLTAPNRKASMTMTEKALSSWRICLQTAATGSVANKIPPTQRRLISAL